MTRKDYIAIAEVIRQAGPASGMPTDWKTGCNSAREYIARNLAYSLAADNPRFDRARFLKACGVQS